MQYKELEAYELIPDHADIKIYQDWISVKDHQNGLFIGRPVAEVNTQCRVKLELPKSKFVNADNIRFRKPPHLRDK